MKHDEILTYTFIQEVVREEMDWVQYHAEDKIVRTAAAIIRDYYSEP